MSLLYMTKRESQPWLGSDGAAEHEAQLCRSAVGGCGNDGLIRIVGPRKVGLGEEVMQTQPDGGGRARCRARHWPRHRPTTQLVGNGVVGLASRP